MQKFWGNLAVQLGKHAGIVSLVGLTTLPMAAARRWKGDPLVAHVDTQVIARHVVAMLRQGIRPGTALRRAIETRAGLRTGRAVLTIGGRDCTIPGLSPKTLGHWCSCGRSKKHS